MSSIEESAPLMEDEDNVKACVVFEPKEIVYWETVVTCSRCKSWGRILGSLITLAVTIAAGLLLSVVLVPKVAENQLTAKIGEKNMFEEWRDGEQDGAAVEEGRTWAQYACNGDDWSFAENSLADYKDYSEQSLSIFQISNGRVFGLVAITLWAGLMIQEFRRICDFAFLLWLPRGAVGECYLRGPDRAQLVAVPPYMKVVIALTVLCRFTISLFLLHGGSAFLAYTESLKDFILNSVALGFILDVDELVYGVFIAGSKKRCLAALGPVTVTANKFVASIHDLYVEIINLVLLIACVVLAYVLFLDDFATSIREKVFCLVCKGQNFPQCAS